jgi:hypothetical protein
MGMACSRHGGEEGAHKFLVGNPEGKKTLRRSRRKCVNNIKTDLTVIGWGGMDWIYLAQDRNQWRALVNFVINLRVP